ncbi:hypothetical protein PHYSODRAFT_264637 [Phytophthora sojae]|uniref:Uncharacterized protein n=1 Tax=Phytophthora sojae (strain P6497) TaxID=1094619 RepID=G5A1Q7_PHYSP|nr:hypothetical protein PHYSODRAFT_264637 [Phytophthora sojae]EGZ10855.1 hypothetical protein PHYSODRAFT_264637 [Phytophthora sojae]|eukprot:XP_009533600.1 hypothetical protein PHYSODRAFT_264637 [Phytophthora sojae]
MFKKGGPHAAARDRDHDGERGARFLHSQQVNGAGGGLRRGRRPAHNVPGSVSVEGCYFRDVGQLYCSCGSTSCTMPPKTVSKMTLVTVNKIGGEPTKPKDKKVDGCTWLQAPRRQAQKRGVGLSGSSSEESTSAGEMGGPLLGPPCASLARTRWKSRPPRS